MATAAGGITLDVTESTVVTFTGSAGRTPAVYSDRALTVAVSLPDTISARKTYWFAQEDTVTVSAKIGGAECADGNGNTVNVVVEDGGVGSVAPRRSDASDSATYRATLGKSNGTDDTASLNAALAAGGWFAGLPGQNYKISAPLVVPSNTVLDMTGCTVTLLAGSNCNLLNNTAVQPQRTVTDAAITSGSLTVTSATAAFTSADVGRMVSISGAGPGGGTFYGKVTSVTNSTTAVLALVATGTVSGAATGASATVSAASMSLYDRDSNITVIGGTWDKGSNNSGATNNDLHGLWLRRVDTITVRGVTYKSAGGKWGVAFSDVTDLLVDDIDGPSINSDLVHVMGPAARGTIRNVRAGTAGDDVVALGCLDYAGYADTYGDITDFLIDDVKVKSGTQRAVNVFNNAQGSTITQSGCKLRRINAYNIYGTCGPAAVNIAGDDVDQVTFSGIDCTLTSGTSIVVLSMFGAGGGRLDLDRIYMRDVLGTETRAVQVAVDSGRATGSIDRLHIDRLNANTTPTGASLILVSASVTVTDMSVDRATVSLANATNLVAVSGTVSSLTVNGLRQTGLGGVNGATVHALSGGSLPKVMLGNCRLTSTNCAFYFDSGVSGAVYAQLTNCEFKSTSRMANVLNSSGAEFNISSCDFDTVGNAWVWVSGGTARVVAAGVKRVGTQVPLQRNATEALSVNGLTVPVDISLLTPTDGDMANNTNSGLACGTGPVLFHTGGTGNGWKHLYTGATY